VWFLTWGFVAQAQQVMTLEECREKAVDYNKELKKAGLQYEEAKAMQKAARTAYLPAVSADVSVMHRPNMEELSVPGYFLPTAESVEDAEAGRFSGVSNVWSPGVNLGLESLTFANGGLSVTQPIYTGGKIKYANKQSDTGVEMSNLALNLKYSDVIEKTDAAFWNVAMVDANIEIAEKYIDMLTELEEQMTAMYDVGIQPASERLRVSVQKNQAELNLLKARNGLKIAKMYLNQILGQDLETEIQISHNASAAVELFNIDQNINQVVGKRNEFKLLQKQKELSEYDAKLIQSDYLPQLGLSLQYSSLYVNELYDKVNFKPMLAAQVNIPIFQWGQGRKKQQAARLKIQQVETELDHTSDMLNLEVMQVKVEVIEAYEAISIASKNIAEAEESLEETKASFDVGLNTTTDMLLAQANWQEAQAQLIQAVAKYKVLETRWQRVTGNLYMEE
jgi:outer membrane protein TolC